VGAPGKQSEACESYPETIHPSSGGLEMQLVILREGLMFIGIGSFGADAD
jgi:hypothetical protein